MDRSNITYHAVMGGITFAIGMLLQYIGGFGGAVYGLTVYHTLMILGSIGRSDD